MKNTIKERKTIRDEIKIRIRAITNDMNCIGAFSMQKCKESRSIPRFCASSRPKVPQNHWRNHSSSKKSCVNSFEKYYCPIAMILIRLT